MNKDKGFTLIELIVVVAVLSLLAILLVPQVLNYINSSKNVVCENNRNEIDRQFIIETLVGTSSSYQDGLKLVLNNNGFSVDSESSSSTTTTYKSLNSCPDGGDYTFVLSNDGYLKEITCSLHGEILNDIMHITSSSYDKIIAVINSNWAELDVSIDKAIDSHAILDNREKALKVQEYLKEQGISVSPTTMWKVYKTADNTYNFYIVDLTEDQLEQAKKGTTLNNVSGKLYQVTTSGAMVESDATVKIALYEKKYPTIQNTK